MSKGFRLMILGTAAAFFVTAVPLAALDMNEIGPQGGIPVPSSNTNLSTAGQIMADVDNYMSYFNYVIPKFDSVLGFGGYAWDGPSIYRDDSGNPLVHYYDTDGNPVEEYFKLGSKIQAGYAARRGGFYLGAWYKGNIAATGKAYTEIINPVANNSVQGTLETEEVAVDSLWTDNQLQLLFGFSGMGIKLGFQEKLESRSNPVPAGESWTLSFPNSGAVFTNRLDEYSFFNGTMVANLGWGMPLVINYMTLCPFLELSLHIYQDNHDQLVLNLDNEGVSGIRETGNREGRNAGYYAPEINAGFTLEMPDLDGGTWIPGVSYNLFIPLYSNSYDVYGITGTVNGSALWDTDFEDDQFGNKTETTSVTTNEISDMYHCLTPSLSYSRSFIERLRLGFSAKFPVSFGYRVEKTHKEERKEEETGGTVTETYIRTDLADTTKTRITVRPEFALGAAFQAVPGVLNLQAGFSLALDYEGVWEKTGPANTVTTTVAGGDPSAVTEVNEKTLNTHNLSPIKGRVSAGFSLNFSSGFALDAAFSSGSSGGDFSLSASEFSLLFVLKK
jgi:hypothetical protein